jgi:hypothetical protein
MLIHRPKPFLSLIVIVLFSCCQAQKSEQLSVSKVLKGMLIENGQQYQFADEDAKYNIATDTLSLMSSVEYDKTGELLSITLFKSEGILKYTKDEVLKDLKLLDFVGAKYKQNWTLINDTLLVNESDTLNIEIIVTERDRKVLLNRKEGKNIIAFELY